MERKHILRWAAALAILALLLTGCVPATPSPVAATPPKASTPTYTPTTAPTNISTPTHTPTAPPTEPPIATATPKEGTPVLGLSLFRPDLPYFRDLQAGAEQAAKDQGVELNVSYATDSSDLVADQLKQMDELISKGVSALLVYPTDSNAIMPGVEAANDAKIPVFTLDIPVISNNVISHINAAFPPNPQALGSIAVETAVNYLKGLPVPPVVQVQPSVVLPDDVDGKIVPPPRGEPQQIAMDQLIEAMTKSGINPEEYRTDAVVIYPEPDSKEAQFSAAPINQGFASFPYDEPVAVLYDIEDIYGNGQIAYEVSFSKNKTATLISPEKGVKLELPASYAEQKQSTAVTLAFFVAGSCYLCVYPDESMWCAVCVR
jgi:ABC-type sugar transport system substrate-binding protein